MHALQRIFFAVAGVDISAQTVAQVTSYAQDIFRGQSFSTQLQIGDFSRCGFNGRASSAAMS